MDVIEHTYMRRRLRTRWRCRIKGIQSFYIWGTCFTFDDDERGSDGWQYLLCALPKEATKAMAMRATTTGRRKSPLMKNNLLGRVDAVQASDCAHIQRWEMYLICIRKIIEIEPIVILQSLRISMECARISMVRDFVWNVAREGACTRRPYPSMSTVTTLMKSASKSSTGHLHCKNHNDSSLINTLPCTTF